MFGDAFKICIFFILLNALDPLGDDDLVVDFPGQPGINFQHYAGYVIVNKENGSALFYWLYE